MSKGRGYEGRTAGWRARRYLVAVLLLPLGALVFAGCGSCSREKTGEPTAEMRRAPTTAPGTAVIEGVVRLAPGAELPRFPENPMVAPRGRPNLPEACTPPQERDREPVKLVEGDRLAGMIVALSEFDNPVPHEPETHELFIRDCRLEPSLVVATINDRLRLTNETDYPFLPDFGGGVMQALLHKDSREVELGRVGMRTLTCGFAASCGRADIVTMAHGLRAVTDAEGRFRIENVPANDELKIHAWHQLFQETAETLTLSPGETREVELIVQPAPPPPPPPPVERPKDGSDILF